MLGIGGAVSTVGLGNARVSLVVESKIRNEHARATLGQSEGRRSADAMVATGNESDVVAEIE